MNADPTDRLVIRPVLGPQEYPRLVQIWRSAVLATHDFLTDADRDAIELRLADTYFPHVTLLVATQDGEPVAFAGTAEDGLEMLFVDADRRGSGVGTALLTRVIGDGVRRVDVNEQNDGAVGFYLHHGFVVESRDEFDDEGRPYPILHLRLEESRTGYIH